MRQSKSKCEASTLQRQPTRSSTLAAMRTHRVASPYYGVLPSETLVLWRSGGTRSWAGSYGGTGSVDFAASSASLVADGGMPRLGLPPRSAGSSRARDRRSWSAVEVRKARRDLRDVPQARRYLTEVPNESAPRRRLSLRGLLGVHATLVRQRAPRRPRPRFRRRSARTQARSRVPPECPRGSRRSPSGCKGALDGVRASCG